MARKTLYIVDGSTLIFRAYFAIRHLSNSAGLPTNAVYGFTAMVRKLIRDEAPDFLAVVFDKGSKTFRNEMYPAYKANRPPAPEDLIPQFGLVREVTRAFNVASLELEGFEADDIIATLVEKYGDVYDTVIVSSDKDLMQLVTANVAMLDTMKDVRYGPAEVRAKMGVGPEHIVDYLALMGDKVDNIPGVPGIGKKSAAELLNKYGSLAGVYEAIEAGDPGIKGKRLENLQNHREDAFLSQELATVRRDVPMALELEPMVLGPPNREELAALFKRLEFKTWYREFHSDAEPTGEGGGAAPAAGPTLAREKYKLVRSLSELKEVLAGLAQAGEFAFEVLRSSGHPVDAEVVGVALGSVDGHAWYVPVGHVTLDAVDQLKWEAVSSVLRGLLETREHRKTTLHAASQLGALQRLGINAGGVAFDPTLASYLLNADKYTHTIDNIALDVLDWRLVQAVEILGSGRNKRTIAEVDLERARDFACDRVAAALALRQAQSSQLEAEGLGAVFHDIELPLALVLGEMEQAGVAVRVDQLHQLSDNFGRRAKTLEITCHELAGGSFAIGSPKQLSEVLFGQLGLPPGKRTKTGYSTDSSVLEDLSRTHPLPSKVLEWRSLTKLKSTYTDQLPKLVSKTTGRIHTTYGQTVAATGRLSSIDPNLQNIPIRTEDGRQIRSAFVPAEGNVLLSADYSQIELRILAHLCGSEAMQQAFRDGADIHRRTASEVFGLSEDDVSRDQRAMAKTINFGILYGMSAWRLAREQGISRPEAKAVIERYFARYPAILAWKEEILAKARETSQVRTLFGRLRRVPNIHSRNHQVRGFTERAAVNTPIQGTAADIIKAAMIRIQSRLQAEAPRAKMVLQVHDELLFDVPADLVNEVQPLVVAEMENVVELNVPLVVNVATGKTWLEAH